MPQNNTNELDEILSKPQIENIPDDLWASLHPTFTGLWTDYHGSLDELQASDVFSISDLLSEEREKKLIEQLTAWNTRQCLKAQETLLERLKQGHERPMNVGNAVILINAIEQELTDVRVELASLEGQS